eukprot:5977026-Pyramimonas_sp.AAC.1
MDGLGIFEGVLKDTVDRTGLTTFQPEPDRPSIPQPLWYKSCQQERVQLDFVWRCSRHPAV